MSYVERDETAYIVVHCAATPPGMDIGREEIDTWHRRRGWRGIGYHFVIRRSGLVELGRPVNVMGAHVGGYNARSVGICWVGGVDENGAAEDNRTEEQKPALRAVVAMLKFMYVDAEVLGHRDFPRVNKECPCFDVRDWWRSIEQEITDAG